jgi:hypothetical protein
MMKWRRPGYAGFSLRKCEKGSIYFLNKGSFATKPRPELAENVVAFQKLSVVQRCAAASWPSRIN